MDWTEDKTGKKYEISYSQKLQERQLKVEKLLLICVVLLLAVILAGGIYAYWIVQRVDAMNVLSGLGRMCVP